MKVEKYFDSDNNIMAIVIPSEYTSEGIDFITKGDEFQQVAVMNHKTGHIIIPHYHNYVKREITYTSETLVIRKGVLNVKLYENKVEKYSFNLKTGDIITLLSGGHGFTVIDDVDMVEIKQGPFVGAEDKTRF